MPESSSKAVAGDSALGIETSPALASTSQAAPATHLQEATAPPLAAEGVEIDSHFDSEAGSDDSGISTRLSSTTTSLSPSVFDFTYANGRRYHSGRFHKAEYYMPNDEQEQSRLDFYHHIFLMMLGGSLYTAPIDHPQNVLDVGTGTGIWAIDFADMHPESKVIGNDISPIQPSWVPPNLIFEVDDVEEPWAYTDRFDYIHMRSLSGSIADWGNLLKNAYKSLTPGGWIEYQDYGCEGFRYDGTPLRDIPKDEMPAVGRWFVACEAAAAKFGRPLTVAKHMERFFSEAGFVDVRVRKEIWPLSAWPKDQTLKEIGKWALLGCMDTVYPFAIMLLKLEGWTEPEVRKLCDDAIEELSKKRQKFYGEAWFVSARKPEKEKRK